MEDVGGQKVFSSKMFTHAFGGIPGSTNPSANKREPDASKIYRFQTSISYRTCQSSCFNHLVNLTRTDMQKRNPDLAFSNDLF